MATDRPREELTRIVSTCGREIVSDPRRTEGLLRDTCASCGREVFILASVQKKNIPGELLALAPSVPREILLRRLAERVVKELGFAPEHAIWAVVSWAIALGVITPVEAKAIEKKGGRRQRAARTAAPAPAVPPPPAGPVGSRQRASSYRRPGTGSSGPSPMRSGKPRQEPASSSGRGPTGNPSGSRNRSRSSARVRQWGSSSEGQAARSCRRRLTPSPSTVSP